MITRPIRQTRSDIGQGRDDRCDCCRQVCNKNVIPRRHGEKPKEQENKTRNIGYHGLGNRPFSIFTGAIKWDEPLSSPPGLARDHNTDQLHPPTG